MSDKIPLPLILYPKKRVHWVLIVFYIFLAVLFGLGFWIAKGEFFIKILFGILFLTALGFAFYQFFKVIRDEPFFVIDKDHLSFFHITQQTIYFRDIQAHNQDVGILDYQSYRDFKFWYIQIHKDNDIQQISLNAYRHNHSHLDEKQLFDLINQAYQGRDVLIIPTTKMGIFDRVNVGGLLMIVFMTSMLLLAIIMGTKHA